MAALLQGAKRRALPRRAPAARLPRPVRARTPARLRVLVAGRERGGTLSLHSRVCASAYAYVRVCAPGGAAQVTSGGAYNCVKNAFNC